MSLAVGASPSPRQSGRHSGSNTARSISEIHTARSTDKLQRGLEGQNALLRSINESLEEEVTTFRQVTAALEKGGGYLVTLTFKDLKIQFLFSVCALV